MSSEYTPQKNDKGQYLFVLQHEICSKCGRDMVTPPKNNDVFPYWIGNNFKAQAERAELVIRSSTKVDDFYICCDCEKDGLADFECQLCKKRKTTNKIQKSFGDPADFLCSDCYETVSAKVWDAAKDKLLEKHQHEFY